MKSEEPTRTARQFRASIQKKLVFPLPTVVVPDTFEPEVRTPAQARLSVAQKTVSVFVYRHSDLADRARDLIASSMTGEELWISTRVGTRLESGRQRVRLPIDATFDASVEFLANVRRNVASSLADDIPKDIELQVDVSDTALINLRSRRWVVVTSGDIIAPALLRVRRHVGNSPVRVRASMAFRSLWSIQKADDAEIQVQPFPYRKFFAYATDLRRSSYAEGPLGRLFLGVQSCLKFVFRVVDLCVESILRLALRSPQLTLRTSQAQSGDDSSDVIRISSDAFKRLGIEPGGQVIVSYGPRKSIAVALNDISSSHTHASRTTRTDILATTPDSEFPDHLIGRLSASVRMDLQCPTATVIVIRRRLRPLVVSHFRDLVIPFAGIVFAGKFLEGPPGALIGAGVVMVVLTFAPLRFPKAPRGGWP
jgi:hypothetical protein